MLSLLHSSAVKPKGAELGCTTLTAGCRSSGVLQGSIGGNSLEKCLMNKSGVTAKRQNLASGLSGFWSCQAEIIFHLSLFSNVWIKQKIRKTCKHIWDGWHRYSCLNEKRLVLLMFLMHTWNKTWFFWKAHALQVTIQIPLIYRLPKCSVLQIKS